MINQRMIDEGARALAERVGKGTPDAFRGASEAVLLAALSGRSDPPHQTQANVDDLTRRLLDVLDNEEELSDEVLEAFKALDNAVSAQPPSPHLRVDVDRLAASIVTAACELDGPADPAGDDTISITIKDLEAVVHRHVTVALEEKN